MNLKDMDLRKLNSITKYPSIPTYHKIGEKGVLEDEVVSFGSDKIILTEKVDGTNTRVICWNGEIVIGSREELLYRIGDLIYSPCLDIVKTVLDNLDIDSLKKIKDCLFTFYFETYGGKIGKASKNYTGLGQTDIMLLDVSFVNKHDLINKFLPMPLLEISEWRENGGQMFFEEDLLRPIARYYGINLVPRLGEIKHLPLSHEDVYSLLNGLLPETLCAIDEVERGQAEGIVFRTEDRGIIAKARFEDYRRTLMKRR